MTILRRIFFVCLSVAVLGVTTQPILAAQEQKKNQYYQEVLDSWKKAVTLNWSKITRSDLFNIAATVVVVAGAYGLCTHSFGMPVPDKVDTGTNPIKDIMLSKSEDNTLVKKAEDMVHEAKKEAVSSSAPTRPEELDTVSERSVTQIQVANQTGASCGYHALLNAQHLLLYVPLGFDMSTHVQVQFDTTRMRQQLFEGNAGRWRQHVAGRRIESNSKRYLKNKLHACMVLTDEQKESFVGFWGALKWIFAGNVLRTLTQEEQNALSNIVDLVVENLLRNQQIDLSATQAQTIINALHVKYPNQTVSRQTAWQNILGYLDAQELHNKFEGTQLSAQNGLIANPYTDNIFNDDIASLINLDRLRRITIIEDSSLIDNRYNEPTYSTIQRLKRQDAFVHAFVVRTTYKNTTDQELTDEKLKELAAAGGTHWIAVVIRKTRDGIESWVADSFNNTDRTHDPDVARLIRVFEENKA